MGQGIYHNMDKIKDKIMTTEHVMTDLKNILTEVIGEEHLFGINLQAETKFAEDINLDSIEYARVFELLIHKYPEASFVQWFSDKPLDKIMDLTLMDVSTFISNEYAQYNN